MKILTAIFSLFIIASSDFAMAQVNSGLMVSPTRVIFEGRDRTATIHLINRSEREETYRISFKNMKMTEDGKYVDIIEPENGEKFAGSFIRYSPRQVILESGASQTVKLLLRKPKNLEDGEYRSHLLLQGMPPKDLGLDIEKENVKSDEIAIKLIPVFGISIPVIVKNGEISSNITIDNAEIIEGDERILSFDFIREGNASSYGNVEVVYTDEAGKSHTLSQVNGVSVFYPYLKRKIKVALTLPEGVELAKGKLSVSYKENAENGAIIATKEIILP